MDWRLVWWPSFISLGFCLIGRLLVSLDGNRGGGIQHGKEETVGKSTLATRNSMCQRYTYLFYHYGITDLQLREQRRHEWRCLWVASHRQECIYMNLQKQDLKLFDRKYDTCDSVSIKALGYCCLPICPTWEHMTR
ncbi:hypothetical protein B0H66DRAFT_35962 [Apodospora peruviana]|uniref:Uncharacterized protein n=1 Tax=Apodospora peruviana TaxID=516989 RepID=A0AAE0MEM2_9PEZI|nr:hypothetical protein B0H66DRAFT_35962 [Apodospora peruviana]